MGTAQDYGLFIFTGSIATFGLFEVLGKIGNLIQNIEVDNSISYKLTLPIKSWLMFCYMAIAWAIESAILTLTLIPVGKILLPSFEISKIHLIKFTLIFLLANIFYGFFPCFWQALLR